MRLPGILNKKNRGEEDDSHMKITGCSSSVSFIGVKICRLVPLKVLKSKMTSTGIIAVVLGNRIEKWQNMTCAVLELAPLRSNKHPSFLNESFSPPPPPPHPGIKYSKH